MHSLKRIRIVVAVVYSIAITFIFLDFINIIPVEINKALTSIQVLPTLLKTIVIWTSASFGLIFVIIGTLLFGRFYCSTLCPLGILQDVFIRIANRKKRRYRYHYKKPYYVIHYSIFILILILTISGSLILLNIFEPFSNYGRIVSNLFSPLLISINNMISFIFGLFGVLTIFHIPILHLTLMSVAYSILFLAFIGYLSYSKGRFFCNTLCPTGALLGILSRISIYKIVIDENNCKECGLCEKVCKANCIKSNEKRIDFAACIGCYNCIDACPTVGMSYKRSWNKQTTDLIKINVERRNILKAFLIPSLGLILPQIASDSTSKKKNSFVDAHKLPISPPGSIAVERFSTLCTACHLCISSCPTQVLLPSVLDYGIAGVFQPKMNYDASYCNFDCVICGNVCPTGAILPLEMAAKKEVQIGRVEFIKDDCIVVSKKKDCGACSEHCPTKAVKMVLYEKKLMIPEINNEICVGCGACEHACPVLPEKAIYVNANPIHRMAKKPQIKKAESSFDSSQDFPF